MAEDKSRTGRFVASQAGAYAAKQWLAPSVYNSDFFRNVRLVKESGVPRVSALRGIERRLNNQFRNSEYLEGIAGALRGPTPDKAVARDFMQGLEREVNQKLSKLMSATNPKISGAAKLIDKAGGMNVAIDSAGKAALELPEAASSKFTRYVAGLSRGWAPKASTVAAGEAAKKGFLPTVGGWIVKGGAKGAHVARALGEGLIDLRPIHGLTGGYVSKFAKGVVRQATSKTGLAAGLAVAGVLDSAHSIFDYVTDDSSSAGEKLRFGIGSTPDGMGVAVAKTLGKRVAYGVMRGVDGILFGIPSLISSDLVGGDDYFDPNVDEMATVGSAARLRADLEGSLRRREARGENVTAREWAQAAEEITAAEENAYALGKNVYGGVEETDPKKLERRQEQVAALRTMRKKSTEWRADMLYDYDSQTDREAPDERAVRHALNTLAAEYRRRRDYIDSAFGDIQAYMDNEADMLRGGKRARWRGLSDDSGRLEFIKAARQSREKVLLDWVNREYSHIQDFAAYDKVRETNKAGLRELYKNYYTAQGASPEDGEAEAGKAWDGMSSFDQDLLDVNAIRHQWDGD